MCTVTVIPFFSGFRLMCNRDERRTRPEALPPQRHQLDRHTALFPLDPAGGGTWIGVNDAGLAATLLNRSSGRSSGMFSGSRGTLVRALLDVSSLAEALEAVRQADTALLAPFRLVLAQAATVITTTGGGSDEAHEMRHLPIDAPLLFTSSSLGDALVEAPRRALFAQMLADAPAAEWAGRQTRFHRHQWRRRPHLSVRMARDDAATVSRTTIEVTARARTLVYRALTPAPGRQWSSAL